MPDRAPYSRVYWGIVDDPKFDAIYDDDHHLAAWLRLLLAADQAHPASASLPAGIRRGSLDALVSARLIRVTGRRFRIVGLDAEREMRSQSARNAAALRWQSERNARRDETRRGQDKGEQGASPLERARAIGVVHPEGETA